MSSGAKPEGVKPKRPIRERNVYVIEIMPEWHQLVAPGLPDGKRCFYVGETSRDIRERFREHMTGKVKPGRKKKASVQPFKDMLKRNHPEPLKRGKDVKLREQMTLGRGRVRRRNPNKLEQAAKALEEEFVVDLRRDGHAVFPRKVGKAQVPFKTYKRP